jgi:hypothetical protein
MVREARASAARRVVQMKTRRTMHKPSPYSATVNTQLIGDSLDNIAMFRSRSLVDIDPHGKAGLRGEIDQRIDAEIHDLPRRRSFRRGWVIPSRRAASDWVTFQLRTRSSIAISSRERRVIFAASAGVFSSASQTLSKI